MYWPNGVPRVYAVNGPNIAPVADVVDTHDNNNLPERLSRELPAGESVHDHEVAAEHRKQQTPHPSPAASSANGNVSQWQQEAINGLCVSRSGHLFATMTDSSVSLWQTRPTVVVAAIARSASSLQTYGTNVSVLMHPDSTILILQTSNGYLLTYSLAFDPATRVYHQVFDHSTHPRRQQLAHFAAVEDANVVGDVNVSFRMAIKIESGIVQALALEQELIVATVKPAAIQCIRWASETSGTQTRSEMLSRILHVAKKVTIVDMIYDRAMNLLIWLTSNGQAYAVQRVPDSQEQSSGPQKLFHGHCFHDPKGEGEEAVKVAVNARFSLLTVSCANGEVLVYTAKDYTGNVPLSQKLLLPASSTTTGAMTFMSYSPDGYCLFAGYENGWTTWSVFGKPGGNSFSVDPTLAKSNDEEWLTGSTNGCWIGGGSDIILSAKHDRRLWILETARSALTGCFSAANLARGLLQTGTEFILYRGHDLPDLMTISGKDSLWHHAQYPPAYLHSQWPIRSCVVSQDGRYVAIAGRRGLAHYSVNSGRWKVFEDSIVENSFAVRGGMCWYGHILIAAVESDGSYELRLYSREDKLSKSSIMHIEYLPSPVVFIGPSGEDSLLVYTYDNILYHYIINSTRNKISLVPVGQIAFNGIVRAPTRVRAISWVLPEEQMRNGDPSQDVRVASVLLLVDGNLVLLQPTVTDTGDLKYDMRVISHDVEYYILMRDQLSFNFSSQVDETIPSSPSVDMALEPAYSSLSLRDSLWMFRGKDLLAWDDIQDILQQETVPKPINIPLDFYPLSVILNKGVVLGVESEMTQRRDVTFTSLKFAIRTHLFLPYFLRYCLVHLGMPAAVSLSRHFSHLSYFPHGLEILLHHVLDDAVDNDHRRHQSNESAIQEEPLLPTVIAFLQASIPTREYLEVVVQCTRKTELRFWRTLFMYLPSPKDLFEQALRLDALKTAVGYLLVLQAFEDEEELGHDGHVEEYVVRLIGLASQKGDWELCAELARFLIALDSSGEMLKRAVSRVGLRSSSRSSVNGGHPARPGLGSRTGSAASMRGLGLALPIRTPSWSSLSPTRSLSPRQTNGEAEVSDN
ncbi:Ribosomal control protein 1 (RIC1) domain-containing protein [Penicillium ucsense]|uniref:Ribosomal control protein 1 (RIC1) domain-containing protein n=1 Tax=Penicillium ucsense TaxID=2839758 RepID=A0A8J8WJX6_9EURO|nr:Ribosomal control protein 1 (RIC1) domain-containing protein [Penicillium ucsense]KAF7735698.1 Ribosomal control protein 1 (RIC1) domain-containing protein [Penicillium ucsense]